MVRYVQGPAYEQRTPQDPRGLYKRPTAWWRTPSDTLTGLSQFKEETMPHKRPKRAHFRKSSPLL